MNRDRLVVVPLEPADYPEAANIYDGARHFIVDISGETSESTGLELVAKEAAEAKSHGAIYAALRLGNTREMVGIATYEPSGHGGQPSQAWLALVMIAEKFQRRGYGAEACRLIEENIRSNNAVQIIGLGVLSNNPVALDFWQKMGYRTTGNRKQDDLGHEIMLMEKRIR